MGWATNYIKQLKEGKKVEFRPRGNSMSGLINDGELVVVEPWDKTKYELKKGSIVLCKVGKNHYLHKVTAVKLNQVQIGNNHGHINGWTTLDKVYGVLYSVS